MLFAAQQDGLMPHGMCYLWQPELLGIHVVSDALVALSYFTIPGSLVYIARKTRSELDDRGFEQSALPHEVVIWLFVGFIVACGITHAFGVVTVWNPWYWISGGAKVATAAISVTTALILPRTAPHISGLLVDHFEVERQGRELAARNEELTALADELEAVGEERQIAIRTMGGWLSHDLKNRLQAIRGCAELLEMGERDGVLDALDREIARAIRSIDGLQEIATSGSVRELVEVDVVPLVQAAVFAHASRDRVELDAPPALIVRTHPESVTSVVGELVENAVLHLPEGEPVSVEVREAARIGDRVAAAIVVTNRVHGLEDRIRRHLFDPFVTGRAGRAGMGLTIARRRAIEAGGTLTVDFPGDSISFRLSLLREPARAEGRNLPA